MGNWQRTLSFPANPTVGQTVDDTGKTYQWNGVGWRQITPSYQTRNRPAGMERIAVGSANNIATLDIVLVGPILTTYRSFTFKLSNFVPASDAVSLFCRFSTDGGASFDAAGYNWAVGQAPDVAVSAFGGSGSDVGIVVASQATIGNLAAEGIFLSLDLWAPTSAAQWCKVSYQATFIDSVATPGVRAATGGGAREAAQDTDAVRFLFNTGNIASVDYALYGWY